MPTLSVLGERLRSRLWPIPALAAVLACLGAVGLSMLRPDDAGWLSDPSAVRGLLEVLAGSSLTVVALVFSLQVVALQLAASQYSPRLLRTYARDRVIQAALGVLISTFVFSLVTLALVGAGDRAPVVSVVVAVALGLASVAALVGVVGHIITTLRVETMMADLHDDAAEVVAAVYGAGSAFDGSGPRRDGSVDALAVAAPRAGFVQAVDRAWLARWAADAGAVARVDVVPGDHVLAGQPLARVWDADPDGVNADRVAAAVLVGHERTPDEDPAYGLVQLVDVALRALSPGVNDPTTAVHAVGHLASIVASLAAEPLGADRVTEGPDGQPRVWEAQRSLDDLLTVACDPVARHAGDNPEVLLSLVRLLAEAYRRGGPDASDDVRRHSEYLARAADRGLSDASDLRRVRAAAGAIG